MSDVVITATKVTKLTELQVLVNVVS